jgi:hypothetical protein
MPSDASTVIELEVELDKLQLKCAKHFYNEVLRVMNKYEVTKSDGKFCMLMACKNQEALYAWLILEELKSTSPDFDRLCNNVTKIQRLTLSRTNGHGHKKEVHLSSVNCSGTFHGKCRNCRKVYGFRAKECKQRNGNLHGGKANGSNEGNTGNGGSNKMCNYCSVKGQMEAQHFKKSPEKVPALWKAKQEKTESAKSSIEVTLTLLGNIMGGRVKVTAIQGKKLDPLAILRQKDVWICDT